MTIETNDRAPRHTASSRAAFVAPFRAHLRSESRLLAREPVALIFGALLPLAAIVVMVAVPAARRPHEALGGVSVVQAYTPVLILFATSMLGLTIVPGILGSYREVGVLKRLRTTPAPPAALLAALFTLVAAVGLVVAGLIAAIAWAGGARAEQPGWFALTVALSTACFVAMGSVLAAVIPNAKAAPGVGNAIAVLMWAASGLWVPRAAFPGWVLRLADLTPGGAAARAMLDATTGAPPSWPAYVVLLVWGVGSVVLATRLFRWE